MNFPKTINISQISGAVAAQTYFENALNADFKPNLPRQSEVASDVISGMEYVGQWPQCLLVG